MSVSLWAYQPIECDDEFCCGDCDCCDHIPSHETDFYEEGGDALMGQNDKSTPLPYMIPGPDDGAADEDVELEWDFIHKENTTWSIAMAVIKLFVPEDEQQEWIDELEKAYKREQEEAEKKRNEELDFFCGRHTFSPWEI